MGWYGVVDVQDAHGLERMRIDERYWRLSLQGRRDEIEGSAVVDLARKLEQV
jgi:hypothetical protein